MSVKALLTEHLSDLNKAVEHLRHSEERISQLPENWDGLTSEELEVVDAFTSRFARVLDLFSNRVLRSLDALELYEPGTLLDVALRAEKRGLIPSADWLRELKDARNRIAHDCAGKNVAHLVRFCIRQTPGLIDACRRTDAFARSRVNESGGA